MKWYNQNGLKILYDAEYSGDYLVGRKYGLQYTISDKIRNDYEILADTANSNAPNSRIQCKTLEFFVTFTDEEGDHSLFYSGGDIDDSDQVGTGNNDYYDYWWTKEDGYGSNYIFSAYPLITFRNNQTESLTDYLPLSAAFIVRSSSDTNIPYPKLWMQIPLEYSYDSVPYNGIEIGSCKGTFLGRLSSEEETTLQESGGWTNPTGCLIYRAFDNCNLNLAQNKYSINSSYADFSGPVTFYGMTISIVLDINYEEGGSQDDFTGTLTIYCNGNIICQLDEDDLGLGNATIANYMTLPRYISNQTLSERYGYWQCEVEKNARLSQPLFVRAYDRALSLAEIQNNTDIDHQRFIGDMDMGWVNNAPPPEGFPDNSGDSGSGGDLDW